LVDLRLPGSDPDAGSAGVQPAGRLPAGLVQSDDVKGMVSDMSILLEAKNMTTMLRTHGRGAKGSDIITAVDNVSLSVRAGKSLAVVGESGSGKSLTCMSMLGLLPPNGKLVDGQVLFKGRDLTKMSKKEI